MGKHRRLEPAHRHHRWVDGSIRLVTTTWKNNTSTPGSADLEADSINLTPGGLLANVIRDMPCPLSASTAFKFLSAVEFAACDERALKVLNAKPETLLPQDINHLFRVFDAQAIESKQKTAGQTSTQARSLFRKCTAPLGNGQPIVNVPYDTTVPQHTHQTKCLSEFNDDGVADERYRPPLHVALAAQPPPQHQAFARGHLNCRRKRVLDKCSEIFAAHRRFAAKLIRLKATIPEHVGARTLNAVKTGGRPKDKTLAKLDDDTRLHLAALVAERRASGINSTVGPKRFSEFVGPQAELMSLSLNAFHYDINYLLLSDKFLPHLPMTAAYVALIATTGWNPSTVLALTKSAIQKTKTGYLLTSVKSKTDQVQNRALSIAKTSDANGEDGEDEAEEQSQLELTDAAGVEAIELLLAHRDNVDKHAKLANESIFATLRSTVLDDANYDVLDMSQLIDKLAARFDIPGMTTIALRKQAVNIRRHAANSSVDRAQAFAAHSDSATTIRSYLNTDFNAILYDAKNLDFMQLLAASANIVAGRTDVVPMDYRERATKNNLLFPTEMLDVQLTESVVDRWFESLGTLKFNIGEKEIYHCALQRRVYRSYSRTILQANVVRFNEIHKPRIAFCEALYELIARSNAAAVLARCERALDAAQIQ